MSAIRIRIAAMTTAPFPDRPEAYSVWVDGQQASVKLGTIRDGVTGAPDRSVIYLYFDSEETQLNDKQTAPQTPAPKPPDPLWLTLLKLPWIVIRGKMLGAKMQNRN